MGSGIEPSVEYRTVVVGAAELVKGILDRLGVVSAINSAVSSQPDAEVTYGALAQIVITNRLGLQPSPLYRMREYAVEHGLDRVFGIDAALLDDDRLGGLVEAVADHRVEIWTSVLRKAVKGFALDLSWMHSDTTSIYFEGSYREENEKTARDRENAPGQQEREGVPLLVKGYNKDGKPHCVQMLLSMVTAGRVPLWFGPWDGNQTDGPTYVSDMNALRQALLVPGSTVMVGDRKLCNLENMLLLCSTGQLFLGAHPWTDTAKGVWLDTWASLQEGPLAWTPVSYVSRNDARKPEEQRPTHRACEIAREIKDDKTGKAYSLRWIFSQSSRKAEQDAQKREKALQRAEDALRRIDGLLGKYDYKTRKIIERRIDAALSKARATSYFRYTLDGSDQEQGWVLRWQRQEDAITAASRFDGVALYCTNASTERLPLAEVIVRYKEQVCVEQTIDFVKSPVQIRPMWLHKPKRLAGLVLLIMIATLVAALLEQQVRRWIARKGQQITGLMPEGRSNNYPTASAILRAFGDHALVLVEHSNGKTEVHPCRLRPVQQKIWEIVNDTCA